MVGLHLPPIIEYASIKTGATEQCHEDLHIESVSCVEATYMFTRTK